MRLIARYDAAIEQGEINDDPLQRQVIDNLQRVTDALQARTPWYKFGQKTPVTGLYLYGPVGVGKTYLMDLFYENLTGIRKIRFHFHHFMQQIDAQLRLLQGQKDPLRRIATNLAKTTRLLCLDEFLVHDVADALMLTELLRALFEKDVVIVATANTPPDELYLNGVQRDRFLPAIALIKQHCEVQLLTEHCDYRLGRAPQMAAYLYPLDATAEDTLNKQFEAIASDAEELGELMIQNRLVSVVKSSAHAVWFDFDVICNLPRSQLDYLEIADRFDTVFISQIPALSANDTVRTLLLIHLIDVMYDRGVRLIVSAAVPIEDLYTVGAMATPFQRTRSRLQEMQSADYLQRHGHREVTSL